MNRYISVRLIPGVALFRLDRGSVRPGLAPLSFFTRPLHEDFRLWPLACLSRKKATRSRAAIHIRQTLYELAFNPLGVTGIASALIAIFANIVAAAIRAIKQIQIIQGT